MSGPNRVTDNRNPAAPGCLFNGASWLEFPNHISASLPMIPAPIGSSSMNVNSHVPQTSGVTDSAQGLDSASPQSPPWTNSTGDLLQETEIPKPQGEDVGSTDSEDTRHHNNPETSLCLPNESPSNRKSVV